MKSINFFKSAHCLPSESTAEDSGKVVEQEAPGFLLPTWTTGEPAESCLVQLLWNLSLLKARSFTGQPAG